MSREVDEIFAKYGRKLDYEIENEEISNDNSREYLQFKEDMMPSLSRYEKLCASLGSIISLKINNKDNIKFQKYLDIAHLDATPSQAIALALVSGLLTLALGILVTVLFAIFYSFSVTILLLFLLTSAFLFYYFFSMPSRLANKWRLKASSQMVPCVLYVVAYMKHTSNLERAIAFASEHLTPPLSLDLRKVFWDIETGKFSNIKDSLDNYLEVWRETNIEFIESFHLIESSLYEPSEERRIQVLERALQVILDGVYEKMLKYSRDVRSPLTNVYMLGIVLPTLAIALLPLASTMLGGVLQWYHVFVIFNLIVPFFVYYLTTEILLRRPGGYGETELLEMNPDYYRFKSKKPYILASFMLIFFLILGLLPYILQISYVTSFLHIKSDYTFGDFNFPFLKDMNIFDFKNNDGKTTGPFGLVAIILSLLIPLGIALFFSYAYGRKTSTMIKTRDESKILEQEFSNSLFQLGNRLGDGMPAEIAFAHVASSTRGQVTEGFFSTVNSNIQRMGMSLEQAIFNPRRGAIIYYPSALISTSMKILVESVKKGLGIAARGLMSISEYIKNIHKINDRVRDLLAEVTSDMKSNMTFLAPLMAGIVVGLATMITIILNRLDLMLKAQASDSTVIGSLDVIKGLFDVNSIIPAYILQISIGIYLVEIVFILSRTLVSVDAGEDKLKTVYETGKNLKRGLLLYFIVALIAIVGMALLAGIALPAMIS